MKDYIISVDSLDFHSGYEVTLLKGLQIVSNYKFEGSDSNIIKGLVDFLGSLSKEYSCQVVLDSNYCMYLISGIREYNPSLIKDLYKTFNDLLPNRYRIGFILDKRKKDSWDRIKDYIEFNDEYEGSTMIGILAQIGDANIAWSRAFMQLQMLCEQANELEIQLGLR